jgi:Tfp pilus assembly protein PilF
MLTRERTFGNVFSVLFILALLERTTLAQSPSVSSELTANLERGHAALKANDPAHASEAFRGALRLDPGNADAHANLGVMAYSRGDCAAAEPEFQSALRREPDLTNALALPSLCERRLDQPTAQADMEATFANPRDNKMGAQVGVQLADFYFLRGNPDHTLPVIHSLTEADPDNVDLLVFEQRIYSEMADNTLNKLVLLAPDSARKQQLIAEKLINAGDLVDAIEHYRKAIAAALAHYRHVIELDPNDAQPRLGLGAILVEQEKPEDDLPFSRSAVQPDPLNATAHYRLARVCHTLGLSDEEQKEMKRAKQIRAKKDRIANPYRQMNRRAEQPDAAEPDEKQ